ncbi:MULTISPECIES: hypothetical protein [unclassified Pseudomonas]|uniref:hypothetical protein n=1 Tax=unclassified Pseudomonas TaxID=196821 RepID=UPI0026132031|nr:MULTISPECIES: hypothetical protein [unclassified Pseudomonas]MEB0106132.1 hypothetical protein [Pseudomonas sp. MH9.3]WPX80430.1 hypothetical protein RHM60_04760 [Pseudomonas sp. MH9.3]WQG57635.1 hypothetical protein RHM66_22070 [Pseudomonas sp. RTB3]
MADKYTDEEQQAWDLYFSAALPLAKAEGEATGSKVDGSWAEVLKQAAGIADSMVEERRKRKPLPEYHIGMFNV